MSQKANKVWGETREILITPFCEVHRLFANKGGVCSKHLHEFKTNLFYVESGKLLIRVWKNAYDLVDETILEAGEYTSVLPNEYHQFEALEDTVCFEIYYPQAIGKDIKRKSVGHSGRTKVTPGEYVKVPKGIENYEWINKDSIRFLYKDSGTLIVGGNKGIVEVPKDPKKQHYPPDTD